LEKKDYAERKNFKLMLGSPTFLPKEKDFTKSFKKLQGSNLATSPTKHLYRSKNAQKQLKFDVLGPFSAKIVEKLFFQEA